MLVKEFVQLRRDRMTFATMIVMIPLMQLMLFGYAINTTPRDLPTAVLLQETSDVGRSILAALQNTKYFKVTHHGARHGRVRPAAAPPATVLFAIEIPANFERALRRGDQPALLVAADATDPVAAGSALGALEPDRAAPRCATTAPDPGHRPRRRSRSATHRALQSGGRRPASTSCPACSAPSSP